MRNRRHIHTHGFALVLAGCALFSFGCGRDPDQRKPVNVVLIVIDTLRVDHLGCYGYWRPLSPNIDRLAADGVRFTNAYSQAPWTTPSVGSLLSSNYPTTIGITEAPNLLPDRFSVLPEVLREHGYATGAVVSHYFLGSKWNFDQGFDLFDESNILGHAGICSPGLIDTAFALLVAHHEKLFFLMTHYFDPHYAYIEHQDFRFGDPVYAGPVTSGMEYVELRDMASFLTEADLDQVRALYDSEIAFTDLHVGRLLDKLKDLGLYDDALIVLTSDHGEEFMERKTIGHGGSLFNELIHVPLIIKFPENEGAGSVNEDTVGLIDLYPTILDILGIPAPETISGRSVLSDRTSAGYETPMVFSETDWNPSRAVIDGHLKLIWHLGSDKRMLFDLAADPDERHNLKPRNKRKREPPDFPEMNQSLDQWLVDLEESTAEKEEVDIDEELRRELNALGYVE